MKNWRRYWQLKRRLLFSNWQLLYVSVCIVYLFRFSVAKVKSWVCLYQKWFGYITHPSWSNVKENKMSWTNGQCRGLTITSLRMGTCVTTFLDGESLKKSVFSRESDSTFTNVYLLVCLSVRHQNPSTAWNHHPSSFIIHHSSFFIHPSFILRLLSFLVCLKSHCKQWDIV